MVLEYEEKNAEEIMKKSEKTNKKGRTRCNTRRNLGGTNEKRRNRIIIALILFGIATIIRFPEGRINNVIYIVSYLIEGTEIVKKAI